MRSYFSTNLLWTGLHFAARAGQIESLHTGGSRFDIEHRGYVLGAILSAANFLEAMINELYQDAHDGHGVTGDGYLAPLSAETQLMLAQLWAGTDDGSKLRPLQKYELVLTAAKQAPLDRGAQPSQDAQLVVQLRNAIAHYKPATISADEPADIERRLRWKFPDNVLMAGAGNPWWPSHCLGFGCAQWACDSAFALAELLSNELGIRPNYKRVSEEGWQGYGRRPDDLSDGHSSVRQRAISWCRALLRRRQRQD